MADITSLFKASVKTVRTRNKALGLGKENGKSLLLPHSRQKSDFSQKTKEVVCWQYIVRQWLTVWVPSIIGPQPNVLTKLQQKPFMGQYLLVATCKIMKYRLLLDSSLQANIPQVTVCFYKRHSTIHQIILATAVVGWTLMSQNNCSNSFTDFLYLAGNSV